VTEILEPGDELRKKLHPHVLKRLEEWRAEIKQKIPEVAELTIEEINADVSRYLEDAEKTELQRHHNEILRWLKSCIGVGSSSHYSPIYSTGVISSMLNFERLLQKAYERKAAEAEKEQKRKAAYKALNVPEGDAKKYLRNEEYAEFVDSIPGAIDAYLTEGRYYAMDKRARPYLVSVARIKNLRREEEAKAIATRQASRFNKELNRAIAKLKERLHTEKQNPGRYFKEKRPISQKLYSCLSREQKKHVFQKVEEMAQEELKTLALEPYREFVKWENKHYYRLSPKADYVFDEMPCLAFSFEIEAVVESKIQLSPLSKVFGDYRLTLPVLNDGSDWIELQVPVGLGVYYQYFSSAELPTIPWQTIPLTLLTSLIRGETEPPGVTILEASQSTVIYRIKDFTKEVIIPAIFADFLKTAGTIDGMVSVGIVTQEVGSIVQRKLTEVEAAPMKQTSESTRTGSYSDEEFISKMARLSYSRKDSEILLQHIPRGLSLDEALKWSLEHYRAVIAGNHSAGNSQPPKASYTD
jgi:hypothetical protein